MYFLRGNATRYIGGGHARFNEYISLGNVVYSDERQETGRREGAPMSLVASSFDLSERRER